MADDSFPSPPTPENIARKLAAILNADIHSFSRVMGAAEEATLWTLQGHRQVTDSLIQQHRGRIVGTAGDSILAEFASVVDAVRCAVAIQQQLKARNAALPEDQRLEFRIGINLGDVMVDGDQIYGDGVNIAARVQALADPGGICISGSVYEQVKNKLALHYEDLGEQAVKNIAEPVRVYRVVLEPTAAVSAKEETSAKSKVESAKSKVESAKSKVESAKPRRVGIAHLRWVVVGVVLLAGTLGAVRYLFLPTPSTQPLTPSPSPPPDTQPPTPYTPSEPVLPLPDKPSLVVLPLTNMSGDPAQDYFSDGLTEDLTTDLSKISSLFVISRNSAFTYKGKTVKVQDIGRELGVRYVLEGSVRKSDNQVRINVQLVDATTGGHLWSDRYDRPLQDIFALQDEIRQKIVFALKVKLTPEEQERFRRAPTNNLEAYDYFLRGVEYYFRRTKEANAQTRQMSERAIALDPQYAAAYALLGVAHLMEFAFGWSPDPQHVERAFELAQRAVVLDNSLPLAHIVLGLVYVRQQQYEQAIAEEERVITLDLNFAPGYASLAEVLNMAGRPEEAIVALEKAMRLDPHYPDYYLFNLALAYRMTGRYEEAITAQKQLILRNPNFLFAHTELAFSYLLQWGFQLSQDPQNVQRALEAAQRAVTLNDSFWVTHLVLGYVYLSQQQYDQALAEMERAVALDGGYAVLAEALSHVGRSEDALRVVEQALRRKPPVVDEHLYSVGAAYHLAGQPEEAIAPLKQYLSRYPNILGAHLTLAAVYSELGKEAEARVEAEEVLRINPQFSLEVHKQRAPIKDPAVLERHLAALRKAGLK